jgi:Immunity protein 53
MSDELGRLQQWYLAHCDGDWEHSSGVSIGTIDNPGWRIDVHLAETNLKGVAFDLVEIERSDSDWLNCKVENGVFKGRGGALNLSEILSTFLSWAESQSLGSA